MIALLQPQTSCRSIGAKVSMRFFEYLSTKGRLIGAVNVEDSCDGKCISILYGRKLSIPV